MGCPIEEKIYVKVKKAACRPVITKTYPTGVELAKQFGLAQSTVYRILKAKSYKEYLSYPYKRRLDLDFRDAQNEAIGNIHEKDKLVDFDHVKGGEE